LVLGIIGIALQVKVKILPIVISEPGQTVHKVGALEDYAYKPTEEMLKRFVKDFVYWARSVPRDEVVYRRQWDEAKKISSVPVQHALRAYAEANNLRELVKKNIAVTVAVHPPFPLSERTFQVDWVETVTAEREMTATWRGIFEVVIKPPTTPEERERNPLGIYIAWFKWQEQVHEKKDKLS
jgi:type IV secretory pathway TrbF-like protein